MTRMGGGGGGGGRGGPPRRAETTSAAGEWHPADTRSVIAALEAGMAAGQGRACRVERLDRRVSEYSTSFRIEELDVTLDGGEAYRIVFKDLAWRSLLRAASAVRPRFLYDPRREIAVYRSLLAGRGFGTAECHAAVADERDDRYWLFLEHVPAAQLCHVGDFAAWEQAARWLAGLHATFAGEGEGEALRGRAPLLAYDRDHYLLWPARAEELLRGVADQAGELRGRVTRLVRNYGRVADRLAALGRTLAHGEFYPSNVLVAEPRQGAGTTVTGQRRICPIDWEMAAVAPGLIDVAALTAGNWTAAQRASMLTAYHGALADAGATPPSLAELAESLEWCRLHLAMQWLGWSADWDAPAAQAHDWLGEVVTIADRLGL